jgi:hypothetical protein
LLRSLLAVAVFRWALASVLGLAFLLAVARPASAAAWLASLRTFCLGGLGVALAINAHYRPPLSERQLVRLLKPEVDRTLLCVFLASLGASLCSGGSGGAAFLARAAPVGAAFAPAAASAWRLARRLRSDRADVGMPTIWACFFAAAYARKKAIEKPLLRKEQELARRLREDLEAERQAAKLGTCGGRLPPWAATPREWIASEARPAKNVETDSIEIASQPPSSEDDAEDPEAPGLGQLAELRQNLEATRTRAKERRRAIKKMGQDLARLCEDRWVDQRLVRRLAGCRGTF